MEVITHRSITFALTALLCMLLTARSTFAAEAHIIVDSHTGYILNSENSKEKRQIASLTKIATGIVALDWANKTQLDLNQLYPVPPIATQIGGYNPIGLQAGDSLSLKDLIYAALMQSDNVAATTIAFHMGDSFSQRAGNPKGLDNVNLFVAQMNALARSQKMENTLFLNPHGLDHFKGKAPYSTAADMARLTRYALKNSGFRFYVSQKERKITIYRQGESRNYMLRNTNDLVGVNGIDGVKTGRTSKAGDCLIVSAERPPKTSKQGETVYVTPRRLIVVVLASSDRFGESSRLLNQGWQMHDTWLASGRTMTTEDRL